MHIVIFSSSSDDLALIARSLPAHDCQGVAHYADLVRLRAQLLIVDISSAAAHLTQLAQLAQAQQTPLLLLAGDQPSELKRLAAFVNEHGGQRLFASEFKPLQRHALNTRVRLLLQLAYPDYDDAPMQQIGDYLFESLTHSVSHAGRRTALTQKEFALALLLFNNLGRPLSRTYLQESVWGLEAENALPTRTIDTHISRVRSKLQLQPEQGFRLSTVYGYGYQLEQLQGAQ